MLFYVLRQFIVGVIRTLTTLSGETHMRILSAHVYSENDCIKLQFEILKSQPLVKKNKNYAGPYKVSPTIALQDDGYETQEFKLKLIARTNPTDETAKDLFSATLIEIKLPNDPIAAFNLVEQLDLIYKTSKSDIILLSDESIKNHTPFSKADATKTKTPSIQDMLFQFASAYRGEPIIYPLDISIHDYIKNKKYLPKQTSLAEHVAHEISTINPSLNFLNGIKLLNPEVNDATRQILLQEMVAALKNYQNLDRFIDNLNKLAKEALIRSCYGMKAHDGGNYRYNYTELQLLRIAKFDFRDDGRMSIKLNNNSVYQKIYAEAKSHIGILEDEMRFLGNIIGLEFSPDSKFDSEIIFTPACTQSLIKKGLGYDAQHSQELIPSKDKPEIINNEKAKANPNQLFSATYNVSVDNSQKNSAEEAHVAKNGFN